MRIRLSILSFVLLALGSLIMYQYQGESTNLQPTPAVSAQTAQLPSIVPVFSDVRNFDAPLLARNLAPRINAAGQARAASLVAEGTLLTISSNRSGPTRGFDIFLSRLRTRSWTKASSLGEVAVLNTIYDERGPGLAADGKTIFFGSDRPGGCGGMDVYVSRFVNGRWTKPENLGCEVNSSSDDEMPSCNADGSRLYFASPRYGSMGGVDLWVSKLVDDKYTAPENLGPTVNSIEDETAPNPSQDEEVLFFSSFRSGGLGGKDLWYSTKENGRWTQPANLGASINSPAFEGCPTISFDKKTFLFSAWRKGNVGVQDIYMAKIEWKKR